MFQVLVCSYFSEDAICIIHTEAQPSIKQKKAGNQHTDNMRLAAILFTYRTDVQLPSHLKSSSRSTWFISSCLCLKHWLCTLESWTYSNSAQHTRQQLFLLYYCAWERNCWKVYWIAEVFNDKEQAQMSRIKYTGIVEKSYSEVNALDAKIYTESTSYKWIFEVQYLVRLRCPGKHYL